MDRLNTWEIAFMVYSLGFSLDKVAAMQEHGIRGSIFNAPPVHRLLNPSAVFFTGTWVRGDYTQCRESADDCLEWVRLGIQYVLCIIALKRCFDVPPKYQYFVHMQSSVFMGYSTLVRSIFD